ncbi:serine hydrolase domain-containing protein [Sphaerisporangium corydalis]|uniref:Serine hydrolase domain-containing protein n=1 Tax=Sphaerisporangium corydalis TaxID=1441875 RepID=A0ABV9EE52_9ACTN|nr:serine hydrolase domain-containing protein [Sphaerisporangium corydalis]
MVEEGWLTVGLVDFLETHVGKGPVPGAVGLIARGDRVEVAVVGSVDTEGIAPMARDSIFRIASTTKPIIAAAAMMLVEDGLMALDDPVARWLPELAEPVVVRTPSGPVEDVVPAERAITVEDLLTFRSGYGLASDFSLPALQLLMAGPQRHILAPRLVEAPDEWMASLARVPLLYQPGEAWLYNTSSDILGVLIARVSGRTLPEFLDERLFEPLGMPDTGFYVPDGKRDRFTSMYRPDASGGVELADAPGGQWSSPPAFPSGGGGLVSTADDWLAFGRMLLAGGAVDGRHLLSPESVRLMTTDHLTPAQREAARLFLEGKGWGFGGGVDVEGPDPWNAPGRYGWIGGSGTAAHVIPSTGTVTILLTQVQMAGAAAPDLMVDFWRYAAGA